MSLGKGFKNLSGIIRGKIINCYDFNLSIGLGEKAFEAVGEKMFRIVDW